MLRVATPLSFAAILALAGCAPGQVGQPTAAAPAAKPQVQAQEMPYRAGSGVVQSVSPAPAAVAAAGATARPAGDMMRLGIRMDDGRMQYVDMPRGEPQISVGQRVELTPERTIRPAQ